MEFSAGIKGGIDAGVNVIANDRPELATSGIDQLITHTGAMVFAIVSKVGCDRACTEVDLMTDHGITDVREMADRGVG
jgi:hypothetical protein